MSQVKILGAEFPIWVLKIQMMEFDLRLSKSPFLNSFVSNFGTLITFAILMSLLC